jgi:predicted RNase H-like HicB family nuclease
MKLKKYKTKVRGYDVTVKEVSEIEYDVKYLVEVDKYPGLIGGGESLEEALIEVSEALEMFLGT